MALQKVYPIAKPSGSWFHGDLMKMAGHQDGKTKDMPSLKEYGCRLLHSTLQELPYDPMKPVDSKQMDHLLSYCHHDVKVTHLLYDELKPKIDMLIAKGNEFGFTMIDKGDAEIAEELVVREIVGKKYLKCVGNVEGMIITYEPPKFIKFQTDYLKDIFERVKTAEFVLSKGGKPITPDSIKDLELIKLGDFEVALKKGGLHSNESALTVIPNENQQLIDQDVESMYPSILINNGVFPRNVGDSYVGYYETLLKERLAAKHNGDHLKNVFGKLVINSLFGKSGSKYSKWLYDPKMMLFTTLTGQLSLIMLVEAFHTNNIKVLSCNTDGVVCLIENDQYDLHKQICSDWENTTSLKLDFTKYKSLHAQSVNSYFAVNMDGSLKERGVFGDASIRKAPDMMIVSDAVINYITKDIPLKDTIEYCTEINRFVRVRKANGGATWRGEPAGKVLRFYWGIDGEPIRTMKGNKVALSDGAILVGDLPKEFPTDIDYPKYIKAAEKLLQDVGYPD